MTWFKVDDSLHHHPKVLRIPRAHRLAALGLWTMAGTWAAGNLTDGHIPAYMLEELGGKPADAERLVEAVARPGGAGLWEVVEDGWQFHDWSDWQPTRQDVKLKRQANADKVRNWRERNKVGNPDSNPVTQESQDGTLPIGNPAPDPTRPDLSPTEILTAPRKRGTRLPDGWEPEPDTIRQMAGECPGLDLRREHLKFCDYWQAKPGNAGTKLDWTKTWRNWMRTAAERIPARSNGHGNGHGFDPEVAMARALAREAQESAS